MKNRKQSNLPAKNKSRSHKGMNMSTDKPQETKKAGFSIFWEELSSSTITVIFLAIVTGIVLGGVLVAATTSEVYAAFNVSFWDGLKTAFSTAVNTYLSLIHISEPTRLGMISYAVFCLKKKK